MLNFTLNFRYGVDGHARGSGDRQDSGCGAGVRHRCDKAVVATIIS